MENLASVSQRGNKALRVAPRHNSISSLQPINVVSGACKERELSDGVHRFVVARTPLTSDWSRRDQHDEVDTLHFLSVGQGTASRAYKHYWMDA